MSWESITEMAAKVADGSASAVKYCEQALAKIDSVDGEINAFNKVANETALEAAAEVDRKVAAGETVGAMAGVPIGIKDVLCTEGLETTCSSRILEGWVPPYSATVVSKLVAEDAVIVGKTNCDEFAMGSSNENSAFGPVLNPVDTSRVPGGSSGGSAACVAADMVPVSLGTDTGGSVRQPASFCGVVGMKPTYGGVSRYGLIAFASSFDTVGTFGKTVSDVAMLHDQIAGHDPRDSTSLPGDRDSVSKALVEGADISGLKVGIIKELAGDGLDGFEPEVIAGLNTAANSLTAAGAEVEEVSIPSIEATLAAYYMLVPAEASSNLARFDGVRYGLRGEGGNTAEMMRSSRTAGFGDEVKRRIMLGTYALSAGYYDAYFAKASKLRAKLISDLAGVYEKFDVLLSPTSPMVAFPFGAKEDPLSMYLVDVATIPANLAGHPGISVPFGTGADDLPIGMQFLGPKFGEATICRAAQALEGVNNG